MPCKAECNLALQVTFFFVVALESRLIELAPVFCRLRVRGLIEEDMNFLVRLNILKHDMDDPGHSVLASWVIDLVFLRRRLANSSLAHR